MKARLFPALHIAQAVEHYVQSTPSHYPRVQLLERAGGGVARIGKWFFVRSQSLGVCSFKFVQRQINFAPDFEQPGHLDRSALAAGLQIKREAANGFEIPGDIVASRAVASGR